MTTIEDKQFKYIDYSRAVACMLITNSHFHGMYPFDVAFGGCPGNCLFFLISGFLLLTSCSKATKFIPWYFNKIIRLYIPLTIVNIITVIAGFREASCSLFLFPVSQLWYIPSIVILYAVYFAVNKWLSKYRLLFIGVDLIIYVILYIFVFDTSVFFVDRRIEYLIIYGFIAMMIGSYISEYDQPMEKRRSLLCLAGSMMSIVAFLAVKLMINAGMNIALKLQFLTHVTSMSFATTFFCAMKGLEKEVTAILERIRLKDVVLTISKCTLEIYLIQYIFIDFLIGLPFPVNFMLTCVSIICAGMIIHFLSGKIYRIVKPILGKTAKE